MIWVFFLYKYSASDSTDIYKGKKDLYSLELLVGVNINNHTFKKSIFFCVPHTK